MDQEEAARYIINKYKHDPVLFIKEVLGSDLWDKQAEIAQSVLSNSYTAVQSCYGSGKSYSAARIALWFLMTHVPSKVIVTSSSWSQVERILFAELASAHKRSKIPVGGRLLTTDLIIEKDWFITGVSPQINVDSEAYRFEGYHSPYVLVIIDQAQGLNPKLWDVATALVSNEKSRILVLGNPIGQQGKFFEVCAQKKDLWHNIKISAFDTPNVKSGKDLIPGLVTKKWVEDRALEWGKEHPLYVSKVLADFPEESDDLVVTLAQAERAVDNKLSDEGAKGIGVDVARFGEDYTVLTYIEGQKVKDIVAYQGKDLMKTCGQTIRMMNKWKVPAHAVCIDDSGLGGGVTDRLHEEGHKVTPINNGSRADKPEQFANKIAEMYWDARELFENENIDIPRNEKLIAQISCRKYGINSKGQIKLETKDEMKKRGLKSPDHAESLILAIHAQKRFSKGSRGPSVYVVTW